ncbi:uncharacterized protein MELLADRAFT_104208 [Melampsora larici-populina 98AG31]|uniref:Secreted protein n=1 Tax=Melampsora larici-populina (strain 98AG31 / pathotype 3-4-7) TaxID=747676 RepID=F4RDY0_MELLP|nr:uncharacterized protein MELLADRAFT_104208 [Melampsora larici-populina 98AG31]EGG09532.1 secreted protein [Melampsora larici-populina 98AG31]
MILIKSMLLVAIEIFLVSQVTAYMGWGDPVCYGSSEVKGEDCFNALSQFFDTSDVYTSEKNFTDSEAKSCGTCTVVLRTNTENCKVHQAHLIDGMSPRMEELSPPRGGMDYLVQKCASHGKNGDVLIFEDPEFTNPTAISCNWKIKISENKQQNSTP